MELLKKEIDEISSIIGYDIDFKPEFDTVRRIIVQYALDCCHDSKMFEEAMEYAKEFDDGDKYDGLDCYFKKKNFTDSETAAAKLEKNKEK